MPTLDPDLARYFASMAAQFLLLPPNPTPLERRSRYWALCGLGRTPWPDNVTVNDVKLNLACGAVSVRLFYGHDDTLEPMPLIIYFHGGGWVVGDTDTHATICARLADEANALVVSVDYPLAPEHQWEQITDACYQAAIAIAADRDEGTPIAVAGDSAGAHLAAVTALRIRDGGGFRLALQVLIYPCIAPMFDTESYRDFAAGPGLTRSDMEWFWQQYAGIAQTVADYRIAPDHAVSLAGLPTTYLVTAGLDPLRDDGRRYAAVLQAAGVTVVRDEHETLPHGYLRMARYSEAVNKTISYGNRRIGELLRQSNT